MKTNRDWFVILLGLALAGGLRGVEATPPVAPASSAAPVAKIEADAAWTRVWEHDFENGATVAVYGEMSRKWGVTSPEFIRWHAEHAQRFQEEGLKFWRQFPADPRRLTWFHLVAGKRLRFWKDVAQGARAEAADTPELAVIDEAARAAWQRDYLRLRAEYLAAPDVNDTGRIPSRQGVRSHELWGRISELWRAHQLGRKVDVNQTAIDFLDYASQPMTGPNAGPTELMGMAMANSLLDCLDREPATAAAFIAAMKLSPRMDLQLFAAGRDQVARFRGKPVDLHFATMNGTPVDLAQLRGKVVLVDIWSIFCAGCIQAMPGLQKTYERYRDLGFEIVSLCVIRDAARERPKALQILKDNGVTYTTCELVGKAPADEFMKTYGLIGFPVTWLLDQQGMLVTTETHGAKLEHEVRQLFGLPAVESPARAEAHPSTPSSR